MHWSEEESTVYIGFDQGRLVRIKVEENPMHYSELPQLPVHTLRITGLLANPASGTFMTVSDDAVLKVSEAESGSVVSEIQPTQGALK